MSKSGWRGNSKSKSIKYFPFKTSPAEGISWGWCGLFYNTQDLLRAPAASIEPHQTSCSHSFLGKEFLSSLICCAVSQFLLFVLNVAATKLIWWLLLLVLDETGNSPSLLCSGYCKIAHCEPLLSPYVTAALLPSSNSPRCTGAWWNFSCFGGCFHCDIRQTAWGRWWSFSLPHIFPEPAPGRRLLPPSILVPA